MAFVLVTDHPDFPKPLHDGDTFACDDRAVAERIASVWNSYQENCTRNHCDQLRVAGNCDMCKWRWYVKEVDLLPRRVQIGEEQMDLW